MNYHGRNVCGLKTGNEKIATEVIQLFVLYKTTLSKCLIIRLPCIRTSGDRTGVCSLNSILDGRFGGRCGLGSLNT